MMLPFEKTAKIIRFTANLQLTDIAEVHFIVDDTSATKILGNAATNGVQMVVTLPGTKIDGADIDSLCGRDSILIWVLSKIEGPAGREIVNLEEYIRLLDLMNAVLGRYIDAIRDSKVGRCPLLAGVDIEQIVTTPEYNTFGGWNGWCASLAFK